MHVLKICTLVLSRDILIKQFFHIAGCNGLHTTTAHNRFLVTTLGVGGMSGYNGLPTVMSGLDESMSDVTAKKKYPFELEKALHNVMFIQHHIQRQDEFNAVNPYSSSLLLYTAYLQS